MILAILYYLIKHTLYSIFQDLKHYKFYFDHNFQNIQHNHRDSFYKSLVFHNQ
jgi:hypothetical protein